MPVTSVLVEYNSENFEKWEPSIDFLQHKKSNNSIYDDLKQQRQNILMIQSPNYTSFSLSQVFASRHKLSDMHDYEIYN